MQGAREFRGPAARLEQGSGQGFGAAWRDCHPEPVPKDAAVVPPAPGTTIPCVPKRGTEGDHKAITGKGLLAKAPSPWRGFLLDFLARISQN